MNARVCLVMGVVTLGLLVPRALAITGGQVDGKNTYSNVGALVALDPSGSPWVVGSGTLIHPRVLLTAGHVTHFVEQNSWAIPLGLFQVSFGTDAFDRRTWHEVETAITHPDYQAANFKVMDHNPACNDVGVVIFKKPIRNVPVATLPYEGFLDDLKAAGLLREAHQGGTPLTIVGYGSTLDWPPPESITPDGLRRFAETEYLGLTQSWVFTLQNLATENGGGGYGDSGGPNFWVQPDGKLVLVSITSRGDPKLVATNIAWRVDIPETLNFIHNVLAAVDSR